MTTGLTLAMAALTTQAFFLAILALGVILVPKASVRDIKRLSETQLWNRFFVLMVFSFFVILLCDDITKFSRPTFGNKQIPAFSLSAAMLSTFVANIIITSNLTMGTGGVRDSIFAAPLTSIPALAILLHEPLKRVVVYVVVITVLTVVSLQSDKPPYPEMGSSDDAVAFFFLLILCLILTTFVGFSAGAISPP